MSLWHSRQRSSAEPEPTWWQATQPVGPSHFLCAFDNGPGLICAKDAAGYNRHNSAKTRAERTISPRPVLKDSFECGISCKFVLSVPKRCRFYLAIVLPNHPDGERKYSDRPCGRTISVGGPAVSSARNATERNTIFLHFGRSQCFGESLSFPCLLCFCHRAGPMRKWVP